MPKKTKGVRLRVPVSGGARLRVSGFWVQGLGFRI